MFIGNDGNIFIIKKDRSINSNNKILLLNFN